MKRLLFLALLVAMASDAVGQDRSKHRLWWVHVGGHPVTLTHTASWVGVNYNVERGRLYHVGLNLEANLTPTGPTFVAIDGGTGWRYWKRPLLGAVFAGPSVVYAAREGRLGEGRKLTVGLAANVQLVVVPLPQIGLGLEVIGNLNTINSMIGLRLSLHMNNNQW